MRINRRSLIRRGPTAFLGLHSADAAISADNRKLHQMYLLPVFVESSPFRYLPVLILPVIAIAVIAVGIYFARHRGRKHG